MSMVDVHTYMPCTETYYMADVLICSSFAISHCESLFCNHEPRTKALVSRILESQETVYMVTGMIASLKRGFLTCIYIHISYQSNKRTHYLLGIALRITGKQHTDVTYIIML